MLYFLKKPRTLGGNMAQGMAARWRRRGTVNKLSRWKIRRSADYTDKTG
jgi:hypothetical protein